MDGIKDVCWPMNAEEKEQAARAWPSIENEFNLYSWECILKPNQCVDKTHLDPQAWQKTQV